MLVGRQAGERTGADMGSQPGRKEAWETARATELCALFPQQLEAPTHRETPCTCSWGQGDPAPHNSRSHTTYLMHAFLPLTLSRWGPGGLECGARQLRRHRVVPHPAHPRGIDHRHRIPLGAPLQASGGAAALLASWQRQHVQLGLGLVLRVPKHEEAVRGAGSEEVAAGGRPSDEGDTGLVDALGQRAGKEGEERGRGRIWTGDVQSRSDRKSVGELTSLG